MVVHGDGENSLRPLLADDVLVEDLLDLGGFRNGRTGGQPLFLIALLGDDVIAEVDALVADVDGGASDEFPNLVLTLPTERAHEVPGPLVSVFRHTISYGRLTGRSTMTSSRSPYSTACFEVMNISRSVSFSIFFTLWFVCFTRMLFIWSRMRKISRA